MLIDVELTRRADGYYVARALQIPEVVVEAPSRDAALAQMRTALLTRRQAGVEVVQLDLSDASAAAIPGWPRHAEAFADDAAYQEMLAEVERQRRVEEPGTAA
jgi:hypothetical protein